MMNLALLSIGIIAFGPVAIIGGLAIVAALAGMMGFAASTKARFDIPSGDVASLNFQVAAGVSLFQGTYVITNAAGFLVQASDLAGGKIAGLLSLDVDNSGGADGDKEGPVQPITSIKYTDLDAVSPLPIWINKLVFFVDDHTVALAATTVNDVVVGRVKEIVKTGATGKVRISLMEYAD